MADLGFNLRSFAYNVLSGAVKTEFENQLGEWKMHTNRLVAYAKLAYQNQQQVIATIHAEEMRRAQMAMFALSLLAGPALSWMAGVVQYRLARKIFGDASPIVGELLPPTMPQPARTVSTTGMHTPAPSLPKPFPSGAGPKIKPDLKRSPAQGYKPVPQPPEKTVFDPHFNQTWGKVYGDLTKSLGELGVSKAIQAQEPDQSELSKHVALVADSTSIELFESNVLNAWEKAKQVGGTAIMNLAGTVFSDVYWGNRLLSLVTGSISPADQISSDLIAAIPRDMIIRPDAVDSDIELAGQKAILHLINRQRMAWANTPEWFYFAHSPAEPSQPYAVNALEAEMWALWIIREEFQLYRTDDGNPYAGAYEAEVIEAIGRSKISLEKILPRLRDLGVVTLSPKKELARREALKKGKGNPGLLAAEVKDVDGSVDTPRELTSVQTWAEKHVIRGLGGGVGFFRRYLPPTDPTNIRH